MKKNLLERIKQINMKCTATHGSCLAIVVLLLSLQTAFSQNDCAFFNGDLIVTNADDEGFGSLRAAIECANSIAGRNRIRFNIEGGGRKTIHVGSTTGQPLPPLADSETVIDGTFQAGPQNQARIVLDGGQVNWEEPVNGLLILGNQCEVYGLEIINFPDDGIDIAGASNVTIGTPSKWNVIMNCGEERDFYEGVSPAGPYEGCGIRLRNGASFCLLQSNIIGTNTFGVIGNNEYAGILIQNGSSNNIVGGYNQAEFNLIANNQVGIRIENSSECALLANRINCNAEAGIDLVGNSNARKTAPTISLANNLLVRGTASPNDIVDLYFNPASNCAADVCQGEYFRSVNADRDGNWQLDLSTFTNLDLTNQLTAVAIDAIGNTSEFTDCRSITQAESGCATALGKIFVTNTNDSGTGSLRAAINCANETPGSNTIEFTIRNNGPHVIEVGRTTGLPLPTLEDEGTIIDASTQQGYGILGNYQPMIVLDGSRVAWDLPIDALLIRGDKSEIYALEIRNFPDDGIDVTNADGVKIGGPRKGNVIYNCGSEQDVFPNATPTGDWEGCGIVLKETASNCVVSGNTIGTNYNRNIAVGNEYCGISVGAGDSNHIIGGSTAENRNYIAYNPTGVLIERAASNIRLNRNTFICNDTVAILLESTANNNKSAPVITAYSPEGAEGVADPNDEVEVFISSTDLCPENACQGQFYLGTAIADANGNWVLNGFDQGRRVTGEETITALATNSDGTSAFAPCFNSADNPCASFEASIGNFQDATCGENNGTITISVVGGVPPYRYNIGNGTTNNPTFENLSRGVYSITITDANGCETTQAKAIQDLDPPSLVIVDEVAASCSQATGRFSVIGFGGIEPYTYSIGDGFTDNPTFSNLLPGEYEVTMLDASGCRFTQVVIVENEQSLTLELVGKEAAFCGEDNGVVVVEGVGGIEPIIYSIGRGNQSSPFFNSLSEGTYTIFATDANGCQARLEVNVESIPPLVLEIEAVENANCSAPNGAITVATSGGTPPIFFDYGNGRTQNQRFADLLPGTYLITATDSRGCITTQSARISIESDLSVEVVNQVDATCGEDNGQLVVETVNGTPPYLYDLGFGATTSNTFNNLAEGNYTLIVTDANDCDFQTEVYIGSVQPLQFNVVSVRDADCQTGIAGSFSIFPSGGTLPITYRINGVQTSNPFIAGLQPDEYTIVAEDATGCTFVRTVTIGLTGSLRIQTFNIKDATCDLPNGSLSIEMANGVAPFTYILNGVEYQNRSIGNLASGNYQLTVIDVNGCQASRNITIGDEESVTTAVTQKVDASCGQSNGQFNIAVEGGVLPYTYDYGNGRTSNSFFQQVSGGLYEVTVTDAEGCMVIQEVFIDETTPVTVEIVDRSEATCGLDNGQFSVEVVSGTAPYRFDIGDGASFNATFTDLAAGVYYVTTTDGNGCTVEEQIVIDITQDAVEAEVINVQPARCDQANGQLTINVTAGLPPYTYSIGNTTYNTSTITSLAAGSYDILIQDAAGCSSTETVRIEAEGSAFGAAVSDVKIADCGQSNGQFNVNVNGGQSPYTYDIGFGSIASPQFRNVSGGFYDLTVTDALGCFTTVQVFIDETPPVTASITDREDATCGLNNGTFKVRPESGTEPYRYDIGNGETFDPVFERLAPGTYFVTVEDGNGCRTIEQILIEQSQEELNAQIENKQDASCGLANGSFRITVNNGVAPFRFDIGNGVTTDATFQDIAAGNYTVSITDASGCSTEQNITIEQTFTPITIEITDPVIATCGQSNGGFTVNTTAGAAPFTYDIGEGSSTSNVFNTLSGGVYELIITDVNGCQSTEIVEVEETTPVTFGFINVADATCGANGAFDIQVNTGLPPYSYSIGEGTVTSNSFTDLEGGLYTVMVIDANGCQTSQNITIDQVRPLESQITSQSVSRCGESNGAVALNVVGGTSPYQYDIGQGGATSGFFDGLDGGNYEITITDDAGCVIIQAVTIGNSSAIEAMADNIVAAGCGVDNGSFTIIPNGGTAPYTFDIGDGASTASTFNDLAAGQYSVEVTDAFGCTTTIEVTIPTNSDLTINVTQQADDFCGDGSGSFTLEVTGGITPYRYDIGDGQVTTNTFENLAPGDYTVTTTDGSGCSTTTTVTIAKVTDLNVVLLSQKRPTCGESNGLATVSASGGTSPYSYTIGNGTTTASTFQNLNPGNYIVTVIDVNGCEAMIEFNLPSESEPPVAAIINQQDVSCRAANGKFEVQASGGLAPYTFDIGNGASTTNVFNDLAEGNYEVTVTDANGCNTIVDATISSVEDLKITVAELEDARCDLDNGKLTVVVEGGVAPYAYDLGDGQTSDPAFTGLGQGTYAVTVTDATGCTEVQVATINNDDPFQLRISGQQNVNCNSKDGAFTVVPLGGVAPYTYSIGNGMTASPRFENLEQGTYTVIVTDVEGCENRIQVEIAGTNAPTASIVNVANTACGNQDGSIIVAATGGTTPYTFDIGNGAGTNDTFDALEAGNYEITVIDANGCMDVVAAIVAVDALPPTAEFVMDSTGLYLELVSIGASDSLIWNISDGTTYNGNSILHEFGDAGTYEICLTAINDCGSDTYCETVVFTEASVKFATIGGWISTDLDEPIGGVNVNCEQYSPVNTTFDGQYAFEEVAKGDTVTLVPEKQENVLNGVTTFDIYLMNSHILTTQLLDTPYKIIAADVNKSGSVTTFDVVTLRRLLLGVETELPEGNTSWRFVDADYEFPNPMNPFEEAFPEQKLMLVDSTYMDVNFIGIKVGDLNNSAVLDGFNSTESRSKQIVELEAIIEGNQLQLVVPADMVGLQTTLHFDPTQVDLSSVAIGTLPNLSDANFNFDKLVDGQIGISWNGNSNHKRTLAESSLLTFHLRTNSTNQFDLSSAMIASEGYMQNDKQLQIVNLGLRIKATANHLALRPNTPNPFDEATILNFELPNNDVVTIKLFDAKGQFLQAMQQTLQAGKQQIEIDTKNLPYGLLYYSISTTTETVSGKMLRVK